MKGSYNLAIDFIKGIAALSVILLHTFSRNVLLDTFAVYHIWQAVPLFFLITFYLGFKSLKESDCKFSEYYKRNRVKKLFVKLWIPLLIMSWIQVFIFYVLGLNDRIMGSLTCLRNGPGSYYIWCYMQVWLLIPVMYWLLNKSKSIALTGGVILCISLVGNYIWEYYQIYSIGVTCFRYLFLSFIAYILLEYKNKEKLCKLVPLCATSIFACWYLVYCDMPTVLDPFEPDGWSFQTSISYFYTLFLFVFLEWIYYKIDSYRITRFFRWAGRNSWTIFIAQMFWIGTGFNGAVKSLFVNPISSNICSVVAALSFCIIITWFIDTKIHKQHSNK